MNAKTGTKQKVSVALNNYSLNRAKMLVEHGAFGSVSDVVATALSRFLTEYDEQFTYTKVDDERAQHAVVSYLQTNEGRALIKSICENKETEQVPVVIAESVEKARFK